MTEHTDKEHPYCDEGYAFLLEALSEARHRSAGEGHVDGRELLESIRRLGADRYGPLAALVFRGWGIRSGGDFGNMVYDLIDRGILRQRDEDSIEDFMGCAPYAEIFEEHYFVNGAARN